jgi:hypothetical protein
MDRINMVLTALNSKLVGSPDGFFSFGGEVFKWGHGGCIIT